MSVTSRASYRFVAAMCGAGLLLASCSTDEADSVGQSENGPIATTVDTETLRPTATAATSTSADASDLDGILVGRWTGSSTPYEIGTIDPKTSEYTKYTEFDYIRQGGPGFSLSPDLTRIASFEKGTDGTERAGWYDADGEFVPGGPEIVNSKFARAQHFESVKFDYLGRLTYAVKSEGTIDWRYFVVDPVTKESTQVESFGGYGVQFLPDGTYAEPGSCYNEVYSFTPSNKALFVDYDATSDSQIYLADFSALPDLASCGPTGQALLPETNTTQVAQPVMTRDQRSVAFLFGSASKPELYTVDIAGGEPKEVPGDWSDFTLMEWRNR